MRRCSVAVILLSFLSLAACFASGTAETTVTVSSSAVNTDSLAAPESLQDRFAYVFGYQMSASLDHNFDGVNTIYIAMGASDYTNGTQLYTQEEMAQIAMEYQSEVYRKAEEMITQLMQENLSQAEAFLASNAERSDVVSVSSQVQYEVLRQGSGSDHPGSGDSVTVIYQMSTMDGSVTESSGTGVQVNLADTIPGFSAIVTQMTEGERVRAWIHPSQAYGQFGNGNIGPNQLMIFDIELISIDR